jgi:hypothetical protein
MLCAQTLHVSMVRRIEGPRHLTVLHRSPKSTACTRRTEARTSLIVYLLKIPTEKAIGSCGQGSNLSKG